MPLFRYKALSATGEPATRVAGQFAAYLQSAGGPALAIADADGKNGIRFVLETGDAAAASLVALME